MTGLPAQLRYKVVTIILSYSAPHSAGDLDLAARVMGRLGYSPEQVKHETVS